MATAGSHEETRDRVCPYLHQLTAGWLSTDADGFYCHGYRGRVTVFHSEMGSVPCALPSYARCSEYQVLSGEVPDKQMAGPGHST